MSAVKDTKPREVVICGKYIPVEYVTEAIDGEAMGEFSEEDMRIKILDNAVWKSTLRHEMMHAFLALSGLTHLLKKDLEEAICAGFEHAFEGYIV